MAASSLAQTDTPSQRVVVAAARTEQALPDALPSTRVIGRAEIEAAQARDLPDLLRTLTSIDVAQTGPLGAQASLFLRGADSRQTLVLVDGVPLLRADFGTASWQHLPPEQVERIEIVRGNLSSLYGAQAVGGVVQIVTRRATVPQAGVGLGSQGTRRAAAAGGARFGEGTQLSASLSWQRTDGYSARDPKADPGADPDRDAARQSGGSARLAQRWAEGHASELNLMASRTRSQYDGFVPGADDVLSTRVDSAGFSTRHALGAATTAVLELGQTRERFDDPTGFATRGSNRVRLVAVQLGHALAPRHDLQLGLETRRERFGDSNTAARTRSTDSLRAAWLGRPVDGVQTQAALRHDDSSDFGTATTGLVAAGWQWAPAWKASVQWSSGFSAPSFLDQAFAKPATTLRPERSRQAEFAVQYSQGSTLARAALFVQRQRDRIAFDPVTFETLNIARAKNHGLEVIAQAPLLGGTLGGELTLQNPRNVDTDAPLARRSKRALALHWSSTIEAWEVRGSLRHVGPRRNSDFSEETVGDRTTLGFGLARQLTATWRLSASVDNATATSRPEVLGYTAPPRALLLTLQGTLR